MTPLFSDFFKSFYYSNTYLSSIDLSEPALAKHLLASEDQALALRAQQLMSEPEVQTVFSEPLNYEEEKIREKNEVFTQRGFRLLGSKIVSNFFSEEEKIPFYSVLEHDELPAWVIKSGAKRLPEDQFMIGPTNDKGEIALFTAEESLLRLEMANLVAKVALEAHIQVVVPKKKLVTYANLAGITGIDKKYFVLCEKIDILTVEETVEAIKNMDKEQQKETARKLSTIIQRAGLVDASFDNIRLTSEGTFAFIDTEPGGLMVAKKRGIWNQLFGKKGASVEKCARIGLYTLMNQTTTASRGTSHLYAEDPIIEERLEEFYEQLQEDYDKIAPKLSKWKIVISVTSLGLVVLIHVIVALVKCKFTKRKFAALQQLEKNHTQDLEKYIQENFPETLKAFPLLTSTLEEKEELEKDSEVQLAKQELLKVYPTIQTEEFFKNFQKKRKKMAQQFCTSLEGVPY